jgi:hypothetical protein
MWLVLSVKQSCVWTEYVSTFLLYCKPNRDKALSGSLRFITWAFLLEMTANFQPSIIWYIKEADLVIHQEVETASPSYVNISASVMIIINAYCKRELLKWCLTKCVVTQIYMFWQVYVLGGAYFVWPWKSRVPYRDIVTPEWGHWPLLIRTRYVCTCVGAGSGMGGGNKKNKSYPLRRILLQSRVKRAVLQVWHV